MWAKNNCSLEIWLSAIRSDNERRGMHVSWLSQVWFVYVFFNNTRNARVMIVSRMICLYRVSRIVCLCIFLIIATFLLPFKRSWQVKHFYILCCLQDCTSSSVVTCHNTWCALQSVGVESGSPSLDHFGLFDFSFTAGFPGRTNICKWWCD